MTGFYADVMCGEGDGVTDELGAFFTVKIKKIMFCVDYTPLLRRRRNRCFCRIAFGLYKISIDLSFKLLESLKIQNATNIIKLWHWNYMCKQTA